MGKFLETQLIKIGWKRLRSCESLFKHEESKLLLSVYVDDLKMVGLKQNIAPMWARIRKLVNLDPETELVDHVYLGCTQRAATPKKESVQDKQRLFAQLMAKERSDSNAGGGGVMMAPVMMKTKLLQPIRSPKG